MSLSPVALSPAHDTADTYSLQLPYFWVFIGLEYKSSICNQLPEEKKNKKSRLEFSFSNEQNPPCTQHVYFVYDGLN